MTKLLSFSRLYLSFLGRGGYAESGVPRPLLEHAIGAADLMRIKFSRWWLRWAITRLRLDEPIARASERYAIQRMHPLHEKVRPDAPLDPDRHPTAFISYSHDSDEHMTRVREFAGKLMEWGIDCTLDQWEPAPQEGWARMMMKGVGGREFVIVVCTETYNRRFMGLETPGVGQGVNTEGLLIAQQLIDNDLRNSRFLPVVLGAADRAYVPQLLRTYTTYDVSRDSGFEDLYRQMTNQPKVTKPKLGRLRALPPGG